MEPDTTTTTTRGYHEGAKWSGHDRWECDTCPFDSLDEAVIAEHANGHRVGPGEDTFVPEVAVGSVVRIGDQRVRLTHDANGAVVLIPVNDADALQPPPTEPPAAALAFGETSDDKEGDD